MKIFVIISCFFCLGTSFAQNTKSTDESETQQALAYKKERLTAPIYTMPNSKEKLRKELRKKVKKIKNAEGKFIY